MKTEDKATVNILFCGRGGQGVLSAAEICAWAAILEGFHVKKSEVHGMAQRGGSVESHVRYGGEVFSPLIPKGKADFLVSFDAGESLRMKPFLCSKGLDLYALLEQAEKSIADKRFMNIFLLGVLSNHTDIRQENWISAIEKVFAGKSTDRNREIFLQGRGFSRGKSAG